MKLLIAAAVLALVSAPAFADAPKPDTKPPEAPKPHTVQLTDLDLQALQFAIAHTGERCGPQGEDFCRAQLMLNDFARRVDQQLAAEARAAPSAPATK